jgi:hypothetical protein
MKAYRVSGSLLVLAIGAFGLACSAQTPPANDGNSGKLTAEEIGKQWGFDGAAFDATMTHSTGSESNGDKLKWGQIQIKLGGRSYEETYARVVKFYADRIGYDYVFDAKKFVIQKGKNKNGQFIFYDVRGATAQGFEPRESSFVYNTPAYTVNAFIRPASAKDTVEIIIAIAVR